MRNYLTFCNDFPEVSTQIYTRFSGCEIAQFFGRYYGRLLQLLARKSKDVCCAIDRFRTASLVATQNGAISGPRLHEEREYSNWGKLSK